MAKGKTTKAAKGATSPEIIEDAIVLSETSTVPVKISLEDRVKAELARFYFPKQQITKTKKKYAGLEIKGVEDVKGYKAVDEARKELWRIDCAIENKRKEIKADYTQTGKRIDSCAAELSALVNTGDGSLGDLKAKLAAIDAEKARIAEEEKKAAAKRIQDRIERLESAGITWNGSFYCIGQTITVGVDTLQTLTDDAMDVLVQNVVNEKSRIDKEEEEAEKVRLAEEKAIQDQKEANEKKEAELKARQDKLDLQEKTMKDAINDGRKRMLMGLGLSFSPLSNEFVLITESGSVLISLSDLEKETEEEWANRIEHTQTALREINQEEAKRLKALTEAEEEETRINNRNQVRVAQLVGMGLHTSDKFTTKLFYNHPKSHNTFEVDLLSVYEAKDEYFPEYAKGIGADLSEFIAAEDEAIKVHDEALEKERLAGMTDGDLIKDLCTRLGDFLLENQIATKSETGALIYNKLSSDIKTAINTALIDVNQ